MTTDQKRAEAFYVACWQAMEAGSMNVYVDTDETYHIATVPPGNHWRLVCQAPELGSFDPSGSMDDYASADDFAAMCWECFGLPDWMETAAR